MNKKKYQKTLNQMKMDPLEIELNLRKNDNDRLFEEEK